MFKQGPDYHFEISEVEITRVNCILCLPTELQTIIPHILSETKCTKISIKHGETASLTIQNAPSVDFDQTAQMRRPKRRCVSCVSCLLVSGEQLVNHLPNSYLLTNKQGLLNSLKEYERVSLSTTGRLPGLKMSDFHPETYKLDEKSDRDLFLKVYKGIPHRHCLSELYIKTTRIEINTCITS